MFSFSYDKTFAIAFLLIFFRWFLSIERRLRKRAYDVVGHFLFYWPTVVGSGFRCCTRLITMSGLCTLVVPLVQVFHSA